MRRPLCSSGALLLTGLALAAPSRASAEDLEELTRRVRKLESEARQLATPSFVAITDENEYVLRRMTAADQLHRLRDYPRATAILVEVIERYPAHAAIPEARLLLADTLYDAGDLYGARTEYRTILAESEKESYRPHVGRALGRLVEIAIVTREHSGVDGYFAAMDRLPGAEILAQSTYFRGKFLYYQAVPWRDAQSVPDIDLAAFDATGLARARDVLLTVPAESPYYAQARYFVAVSFVLERQLEAAIDAFQQLASLEVASEEQGQVAELAQLSLGRLLHEAGRAEEAIEVYHRIPSTSPLFGTALYEVAWVHIQQGDTVRAEQALDLLTVSLPDSRYAADGALLRANLLLRDGRLEAATEIFAATGERYRPVKKELERPLTEQPDPAAYFRALAGEGAASFELERFVPTEAQPVAEEHLRLQRGLGTLSSLSETDATVRELERLVARLEAVIESPSFVDHVIELRNDKVRAAVVRNKAAKLRAALSAAVAGAPSAEQSGLLPAIQRLPESPEDFDERDEAARATARALQEELDQADRDLSQMQARAAAAERALEQAEVREGIDRAETQRELAEAQAEIQRLQGNITQLEAQLASAESRVGFGDERYQDDEQARRRFVELTDARLRSGAASALLARLVAVERQADALDAKAEAEGLRQKSEMRERLALERAALPSFRGELTGLDGEAEQVVGPITELGHHWVHDQFSELVLHSDLGSVDVAWAQREEYRERVERLTRDRAQELSALDEEYREIMEDPRKESSP